MTRELTAGGTFTATLTVTDDKGFTASTTLSYIVNQAPVAVASASAGIVPVGGSITFDGTGSSDPDGTPIAAYHWSFSDGVTSDTALVTRELTAGGTFTATLTVTDDKGFTASSTVSYIVDQAPVAVASASAGIVPAGGSITFDGTASSDPDGTPIAAYHWSFSDGVTSDTAIVTRELTAGGAFTATLTVTDNNGFTAASIVSYIVDHAPVAVASASAGIIPIGGTLTFDGTGSSDPDGTPITKYHWSFSDGVTADTALVTRELSTGGTFTATLTVTDDKGFTASSTTSFIVNQAPEASFATSPATHGTIPFAVNFDASSSLDPDVDDSIVSYHWDFGDGTSGSGATISKTYQVSGTFTTILTVTDTRGATSTTEVTLVVTADPTLVLKVSSIVLTSALNRSGIRMVQASVKLTDLEGNGVSGVSVSGRWSGLVNGNSSTKSGNTGVANMVSRSLRSSGTITFTITSVSKAGYIYDASQSVTSMSGTF